MIELLIYVLITCGILFGIFAFIVTLDGIVENYKNRNNGKYKKH